YCAIQYFGNDLRFLASSGGGDILFQYGKFIPTYDNNMNLGTAGNRWAIIYAAVGTIQTSDERSKQQIRTISDAERAVAIKLKNSLRAFKFNDSVASKTPETARWHFGTIAQNVQEAFTSEGLDGFAYGVLCYDTWGDTPEVLKEDGSVDIPAIPAGNRYGIRYDELLCFIIAAM
ncbi:MAG: tail fiber domain-containing protein, partial [Ignisphaera sp.]|nr:tail fiber domain-containing protein [Ignisphaera sp.]